MSASKELFLTCASSTTCHGVSQVIAPNRTFSTRFIWMWLILCLTGGLVSELYIKLNEYFAYDTTTTHNTVFDPTIEYPSIVLCNFNRFFNISYSALLVVDALDHAASPRRNESLNAAHYRNVEYYYMENGWDYHYHVHYGDLVKPAGWNMKESLLSCEFAGEACTAENFTALITRSGVCYTFTPQDGQGQKHPGRGNGLKMTFDILQERYSEHPDFGNSEAGLHIQAFPRGFLPDLSKTTALPPGQTAFATLQYKKMKLMYKPWGICEIHPKKLKYFESYSMQNCMEECRIDYIISTCDCHPYWVPSNFAGHECDVWDILNCSGAAEVYSLANLQPPACGCEFNCDVDEYRMDISYAAFPSIYVGRTLVKEEEEGDLDYIVSEPNPTNDSFEMLKPILLYRENHLMLQIYYHDLVYDSLVQAKAVTEVGTISDLGGLLGLWMGTSIVTLAEFFQLLLQICRQVLRSHKPDAVKPSLGNGVPNDKAIVSIA